MITLTEVQVEALEEAFSFVALDSKFDTVGENENFFMDCSDVMFSIIDHTVRLKNYQIKILLQAVEIAIEEDEYVTEDLPKVYELFSKCKELDSVKIEYV